MSGLTALVFALGLHAQEVVNVPLKDLKLAPLAGVKAEAKRSGEATALTFSKPGEERRFLALEGKVDGDATGAKALALKYRLSLTKGTTPRLAALVFDQSGGSWFKVGPAAQVGELTEGRLSVAALQQTGFSESKSGKLEWDKLQKVWVGLVFDGPAEGSFEVREARLTGEAYKPTSVLRITGDGPGKWSVGQDAAVKSTCTTPNEGPGGKACLKYDFTLPGGRHMYAIPSTPMPDAEVEGYRALRFTYKATLPEGIKGLLVMLGERVGCQYYANPMPPASADWTTITIPFEQFTLGEWTKDPDGKLDLDDVVSVMIGTHGAASGGGGPGLIMACDLEFVP
jgi:hypothetical protein